MLVISVGDQAVISNLYISKTHKFSLPLISQLHFIASTYFSYELQPPSGSQKF